MKICASDGVTFARKTAKYFPLMTCLVRKNGRFSYEKSNYRTSMPDDVFIPFFEIATVACWKSIATNLDALYTELYPHASFEVPDALSSKMQSAKSIDDKIRYCIDYVQDEIIYLFDADVMHGHVPQSPQDVIA